MLTKPGHDRRYAQLDLRGLNCPLPVLRTRKAMRRLACGETIEIVCTDPLAAIDIPHLACSDGHRLDAQVTIDGVSRFRITKQTAEAASVDAPAPTGSDPTR